MTPVVGLALLATLACGAERADVKHMTDVNVSTTMADDSDRIDRVGWGIPTTVEALAALPVDPPVRGHEPRGVRPEEFHVYTVEAVVGFAKKETDQDAHIVLLDGVSSMIVESVDPRCASGSAFLAGIEAARRELLAAIGAKTLTTAGLRKLKGKRVRVIGPAFFDKLHGQTGVAPNGVEIHPILSLEVLE